MSVVCLCGEYECLLLRCGVCMCVCAMHVFVSVVSMSVYLCLQYGWVCKCVYVYRGMCLSECLSVGGLAQAP